MWVVQEVAFSKRADIRFGSKQACWADLRRFVLQGEIEPEYATDFFVSSSLNSLRLSLHEMLQSHLKDGTINMTASDLLLLCQFQSASEPKDKVYGAYGLLQAMGVQLPAPDYTKTTQTVYLETCQAVMAHDNSLRLLGGTDGVRTLDGLSSWVPDFSSEVKPFPIDLRREDQRASGSSDAIFSFSHGGSCIRLLGIVVDRVESCSSGMWWKPSKSFRNQDSNELGRTSLNFVGEFVDWRRLALQLSSYPTGDSVKEAFMRTVYRQVREPCFENLRKGFDDVWKHSLEVLEKPSSRGPWWVGFDLECCHPYADDIKAVELCYYQKFFITHSGYMGLGSIRMEVGDLVCLISGFSVPLLMRSIGNGRHGVVGPAHVYGMMRGELWRDGALKEFDAF